MRLYDQYSESVPFFACKAAASLPAVLVLLTIRLPRRQRRAKRGDRNAPTQTNEHRRARARPIACMGWYSVVVHSLFVSVEKIQSNQRANEVEGVSVVRFRPRPPFTGALDS